MRRPLFWDSPYDWRALALYPLGVAYGAITAARMASRGYTASIPVFCAGNFVAGGAGKTPLVIALAKLLKDRGYTPICVSRGFGGRFRGPVEVQPGKHKSADVGDEALLLAQHLDVVVSKRRVKGIKLAEKLGADCVLLDDGFQNPSVTKSASLLAVDAAQPIGNGYCIPAGPLRAPIKNQMRYAAALILILSPGRENLATSVVREAARKGLPVITARLTLSEDKDPDASRPALAFTGIGRPQKFFDSLTARNIPLVATRAFPDHHPFRDSDIKQLLADAKALNADLLTTQKDAVRFDPADPLHAEILETAKVIPAKLIFDDPNRVFSVLETHLR